MEKAIANASDHQDAKVVRGGGIFEHIKVGGSYLVECFGPDGKLKWVDTIDNLVTTEGKNHLLDSTLDAASQITTWYIGLISLISYGGTGVAVGDTAAQINGTNDWKEAATATAPDYDEATRVAATFGTVSAGSLATSAASSFAINETGTAKGCFLVSLNTKDGTTGTLYSAGLFTGGDKAVGAGDTLNVSYTATIT